MPLSSLYPWLKFCFQGNDAKPLLENTSKPPTQTAVILEQVVNVQISAITTASARVSSIADRCVQEVIKIYAGESSASTMALRAIEVFSDCTKTPIKIVAEVERCAYDAAINTTRPTQADLSVTTKLKIISARISRWAHTCDVDTRDIVGKINRAEGRYAGKSARFKMGGAAVFIAAAEAGCTISKIVEDHVANVAQNKMTVPFIEALLFAIHIATIQAAFDAAEAVTFVDPERPPPYEEKPSYEEAYPDNEVLATGLTALGRPTIWRSVSERG